MLMHPEWLKVRRSPTAWLLTAVSLALPLLIWALNRYGPEEASARASLQVWLLAPYALVGLLAPFVLTLDDQLGTLKWIQTTPSTAGRLLLGKWGLVLCACLVSLLLMAGAGLMTGVTVPDLLMGVAGILTSLLVISVLSLLTRSFAAVLIIGVVWIQLAPRLLSLLPESMQQTVWAMLPGLGLSQYSQGPLAARLLSVALLMTLLMVLLRRRNPAW